MAKELERTLDHRNCPACEALNIELMGLDNVIGSLGYDQVQRIKDLARRSGISSTSLVDAALDAFEKSL
jgi:hypothetical protein